MKLLGPGLRTGLRDIAQNYIEDYQINKYLENSMNHDFYFEGNTRE
jgi:hypothetical protein